MFLYILLFLFIAVPIAEISVLIKVGAVIGGATTILLVIFTAILGAYLVRQQGLSTLHKLHIESQTGRLPVMQIGEGALLLLAGVVLLTPGFITDVLGFMLLVPRLRRAIVAWFAQRSIVHSQGDFRYTQASPQNPNVIEGEYKDRS